jgi:hypothetical protein
LYPSLRVVDLQQVKGESVRANASKSGKRWLKTLELFHDFLA